MGHRVMMCHIQAVAGCRLPVPPFQTEAQSAAGAARSRPTSEHRTIASEYG